MATHPSVFTGLSAVPHVLHYLVLDAIVLTPDLLIFFWCPHT